MFDVADVEGPGFAAEARVWTLGQISIGLIEAPAVCVLRSPAIVRKSPMDHWAITLGRSLTRIRRRGEWSEVAPNVPFVVSLGEPLDSARGPDSRIQVYVPRDVMPDSAARLDHAVGRPLVSPLGGLLADYLGLIGQRLPEMGPDDMPRLQRAILTMIEACVAPTADSIALAAPQIDLGRMERVRRVVRRHLRTPSLGVGLVCREVGMSRSQLYRLLEPEGGVAHFIQRQRLQESYALLQDRDNTQTVAEIAEALCFSDASSFSRAFRRTFGLCPRDVRMAGDAPDGRIVAVRRVAAGRAGFMQCLRTA